MLTCEIKINNQVIGTVEARRVPGMESVEGSQYWAKTIHETRSGCVGKYSLIRHRPGDGAHELLRKILADFGPHQEEQ